MFNGGIVRIERAVVFPVVDVVVDDVEVVVVSVSVMVDVMESEVSVVVVVVVVHTVPEESEGHLGWLGSTKGTQFSHIWQSSTSGMVPLGPYFDGHQQQPVSQPISVPEAATTDSMRDKARRAAPSIIARVDARLR
jgi:hypothetical protein